MGFWYNRLKIRPIHSDLSPQKTPTLSRTLIYKYRFRPLDQGIARINWRRLWETLVSLRREFLWKILTQAAKQKAWAAPFATQALQVMTGAPPLPVVTGSVPAALPQASLPPRVIGPVADPPRRRTSSDTSTEKLSPALLGAIQQIVAAALREHVSVAAPPRLAPPSEAEVLEEEGEEEAPVPVLPAGRRRDIP
ncbi:UNVERIFIED_CONTAM: hypothetical protein Slati_3443300 [Sesamum latifolium]|uniref:Uncharacterized protein n=1 Tax=Sesamum latifolium TaxID=2727402 RepID=A0AAW2UGP5_9LAMI